MDCRLCTIFLLIISFALAMHGCQCGESPGGPSADTGVGTDTTLGPVVELRPEAQPAGIFPAQPVVPAFPLDQPAPVSVQHDELPQPLQRSTDGLLEPPRQELPRGAGSDTPVGGGGGQAERSELLVDTTRPEMRGGYYIFGFDYVAGMTDIDNSGGFAPEPRINAEDDVI